MEIVRDRTNLEFIDHSQTNQFLKTQSKLSFKRIINWFEIFSVYKFDKEKTFIEKPIYLGFSVLELSKLLMYEFCYHTLEPSSKHRVYLHYMDTDSFVLSFDANNLQLLEVLQQNKNEFEFSELDKSHELYNPINKKVIRKVKIETSPVLVLDSVIALGSKSYSFSYHRAGFAYQTIQKAKQKGIQKPLNVNITNVACLILKQQMQQFFRSNLHQLSVEE